MAEIIEFKNLKKKVFLRTLVHPAAAPWQWRHHQIKKS
jgi:hypothetical protein